MAEVVGQTIMEQVDFPMGEVMWPIRGDFANCTEAHVILGFMKNDHSQHQSQHCH